MTILWIRNAAAKTKYPAEYIVNASSPANTKKINEDSLSLITPLALSIATNPSSTPSAPIAYSPATMQKSPTRIHQIFTVF